MLQQFLPREKTRMQENLARILVIDDERTNINALGTILSPNYIVSVALSAQQAIKYLGSTSCLPDLILLDVVMPQVSGFDLCQQLKKDHRFQHIPIIFISAITDPMEKVKGLQAGAIDFISKPFNTFEVEARIETHLKITTKQQALEAHNQKLQAINSSLTLGPQSLIIDEHTLRIVYKKKSVELTKLEFKLFQLLYAQPERVYSRMQILDLAYPDLRDISDRSIDAHVKNIRKKIKTLGIEHAIIQSVYGAGYRYSSQKLT
ncbi:hypothetical protein PAUR_a1908 [Pseudoalteromonas aurantia 208]|uniref:DNA-binding response regulator n=2 Tax=Pseudoalteromonas aurantia TaxID=43654 RepID=A0ABR9EBH4_9GAMM|nr:hypothetical protein [Pseudoalteromonas aurantia 208]